MRIKKELTKLLVINLIFLLVLTSHTTSASLNESYLPEQITSQSTYDGGFDLLIIAPERFAGPLHKLVDHKEKVGISTKMVTLDQVYEEMLLQGRDKPEKIKYFIKESIETWGIKYVLLVGGRKGQLSLSEKWWLPVRYSHIEDRRYPEFTETQFISDLYFADIYDEHGEFSSWDTNDNGVFGEWLDGDSADDIIDLLPDVYVGRLPCRNVLEVRAVVRKIISYETKTSGEEWFNRMVVVAGDTYPNKNDYNEGEQYTQMALDMMPGFDPVRLWASDGSLKSWVNVVKAVNKGCGFLYFSGHGSPTKWATYRPDDKKSILGLAVSQMMFLRNGEKLPITVVGGCHNSMFNSSIFLSSWSGILPSLKCWSWALTKKINGGSIATIGPTGFSYGPTDISSGEGGSDWLDMHFFGEYGLNGNDILGEIWGKTIIAFLQNFSIEWNEKAPGDMAFNAKNVEQWVLLGDPSLKVGGYR